MMKVQCSAFDPKGQTLSGGEARYPKPSEQRTDDGPKAAHIATTGRGSFPLIAVTSRGFRTSRAPRG